MNDMYNDPMIDAVKSIMTNTQDQRQTTLESLKDSGDKVGVVRELNKMNATENERQQVLGKV